MLPIDGQETRDVEIATYKILQAMQGSYFVNGRSLEMYSSVGVAIYLSNPRRERRLTSPSSRYRDVCGEKRMAWPPQAI